MRKLITLLSLMVVMAFCITGCGGNKIESGIFLGSTGDNTFIFNKDGTCSYEEVHGEKTDTYQGTWTKSDEENTYKIVLDGVNMTLFGEVSDSGAVTVTSDSSGWANETFTKQ